MTTARAVSWSDVRRDSGVSRSPRRASGSPNIPCSDSRSMPDPSPPRAPSRPVDVLLDRGRRLGHLHEQLLHPAPRPRARLSTEWEASSRAHTHSSVSSSGRLQSSAKEAMLAVTMSSSSDGVQGRAKRVLAHGPLRQVADHRAHLQAEEHGPDGVGPLAEQVAHAAQGIVPAEGVLGRRIGARRGDGGAGLGGHGRQHAPPRVEGPRRPVARGPPARRSAAGRPGRPACRSPRSR